MKARTLKSSKQTWSSHINMWFLKAVSFFIIFFDLDCLLINGEISECFLIDGETLTRTLK